MQPAARDLLRWYDRHRRTLPWRAPKGVRPDPYRVWLSEIMLQQTTVKTVAGYFDRFLERWPTLADLARAPIEDVLEGWAGLGYYSRARNLHACARKVVDDHGGHFPEEEAALRALPGVGAYTAAAVRAIAYDRPAVVVDGNVERVAARLFALDMKGPALKEAARQRLAPLVPADRSGDFAQAMMDLGATLCTPTRPVCGACPWSAACAARRLGAVERFPAPKARKLKPTRRGVLYWLVEPAHERVLLRRRPPKGLLGGMLEFPSSEWIEMPSEQAFSTKTIAAHAPCERPWRPVAGLVKHTFTHFHLELLVVRGRWRGPWAGAGEFVAIDQLAGKALPTVMRKAAALAHDRPLPLFAVVEL